MPGLAGLISLEGIESDAREVAAMLQAMPHRGTVAKLNKPCPHVTLGICWDADAHAPHHATAPGFELLLDGEVHDGLHPSIPPSGQGDSPAAVPELLKAFSRHKQSLFPNLIGEFAIVIWDDTPQELTLVRDAFGTKPLFYHRSNSHFAFASEIKALLALEHISASLNRERIADFFHSTLEGIDTRNTFFKNIYRVPAGYYCRLIGRSLISHRHWQPGQDAQPIPDKDDWIDAFATTFDSAVRCRYQTPGNTGILLSGGLDSCSIAATASALHLQPVNTFSLVSGRLDPACEESHAIGLMQESHAFNSHTLSPDEVLNNTPSIPTLVQKIENPFAASLLAGPIPLYTQARQEGLKVVLDGVDGDVAASLSGNYHWFLANEFGTTVGARELMKEALHFDEHRELPKLLASFLLRRLGNLLVPRQNALRLMARSFQSKRNRTRLLRDSPLRSSFIDEVQLLDRYRQQLENEHPTYPSTVRDACSHTLTAPYLVAAIERYEEAAASFSLRATHPFMDLRLIRLCLNMPWHFRTRDGVPKWILRQAMTTRLPAPIIQQYKIGNIGHWFIDKINRNYLRENPHPPPWVLESLEDFIRIDHLKREWGRAAPQTHAEIPDLVSSSIVLSEWLRHHF